MRHLRQTSNPRALSLSHLRPARETTWDSRCGWSAYSGAEMPALILDTKSSIDLLLPLVALGHVIAPRSLLAVASRVALQGPKALPRSEHVGTCLAESLRAECTLAILPTEPSVRPVERFKFDRHPNVRRRVSSIRTSLRPDDRVGENARLRPLGDAVAAHALLFVVSAVLRISRGCQSRSCSFGGRWRNSLVPPLSKSGTGY